jgi:hypothetical protein
VSLQIISGRVARLGQVAELGISVALVAPLGIHIPTQALKITLVGALVALLAGDVALLAVDVALLAVDVALISVLIAPLGVLVTLIGILVAQVHRVALAGLGVLPRLLRSLRHDERLSSRRRLPDGRDARQTGDVDDVADRRPGR